MILRVRHMNRCRRNRRPAHRGNLGVDKRGEEAHHPELMNEYNMPGLPCWQPPQSARNAGADDRADANIVSAKAQVSDAATSFGSRQNLVHRFNTPRHAMSPVVFVGLSLWAKDSCSAPARVSLGSANCNRFGERGLLLVQMLTQFNRLRRDSLRTLS